MNMNKENEVPKKKRVRSTTKQISILTDYMAAHPRLANNEFNGPQGKAQRDRQWESLRILLKEYGPDKTVNQWEHTWRDLRRNARTTGARVNSAQRATGNIVDVPDLSPQIVKILGTIGAESAYGIAGAEETGVGFVKAILDPTEIVDCSYYVEPATVNSEPILRTSGSGLAPEASGSGLVSGASGSGLVSGASGSGLVPGASGSWLAPGASGSGLVSGASGSGLVPGASGSWLAPGASGSGLVSGASGSGLVPGASGSGLVSGASGSGLDPGASGSGLVSGASGSWLAPEASGSGITENVDIATSREPVRRRQGLGTRAEAFLQAEIDTNSILRDISKQLSDMNNQSAMRARMSFRERMRRLRTQRFTF